MEPTNTQLQEGLKDNIPYDVIELPSKGLFYKNKKASVKVGYLTAADENIIMSQNLVQSGEMIDVLLRAKIMEPDVIVQELLECDKEAILIFLRNTAYGATYKITLIDPETKKTFEADVDISQMKPKDFDLIADSDGNFSFDLPVSQVGIKFKFLNGLEEAELTALPKRYSGKQVAPLATKRLEKQIMEISGEKDPAIIAQRIQTMPIKDAQELKKYINDNQPGLDLDYSITAPSGNQMSTRLSFGSAFFRPFFGV